MNIIKVSIEVRSDVKQSINTLLITKTKLEANVTQSQLVL